ncbi:conserved hypothetical protein [Culex quinquefasciatus]|uniref:Uncharacterized protein n=1 Tax=Culex quinquefasciatus TaxID=7176 RepID=B0XIW0_CULQU|nr:conserved hypothetical protein [Culex quinquefasciatus]|eukprot:XP_001869582.1 conserved hypothetical protein [Culex quinquefasciatus]
MELPGVERKLRIGDRPWHAEKPSIDWEMTATHTTASSTPTDPRTTTSPAAGLWTAPNSSIFSAEEERIPDGNTIPIVIFTDSASVVEAVENGLSHHPTSQWNLVHCCLPIAKSVCTAPAVQEDAATKPSHESKMYSCQLFNANVARSTDRDRAAGKLAEKLLQSVNLASNEGQFRLVWDPGVQPSSASRSTTQLTEEHTLHGSKFGTKDAHLIREHEIPTNSSVVSGRFSSSGFDFRSRTFNPGGECSANAEVFYQICANFSQCA